MTSKNGSGGANHLFAEVASRTSKGAGKAGTFIAAVTIVALWAVTGPLFGFSETWQLVINTGTTIVTFLMVFVLQNSQNRDGAAIQAKLDELVRVSKGSNKLIGIEHLNDEELDEIRAKCEQRAAAEDRSASAMKRPENA
jgi:low affinity Fe/Cu permease